MLRRGERASLHGRGRHRRLVTRRRSRRTAEPSTCPIRHRAGSPCSAAPRTDRSQAGRRRRRMCDGRGHERRPRWSGVLSGSSTLAQATARRRAGGLRDRQRRSRTVGSAAESNGLLAQTDCLDEVGAAGPPDGRHEVKGGGGDAAFTPDGEDVVLNASFGLSFFTFDRTTGKLTQRPARGCIAASCPAPCVHVPGILGGFGGVTARRTAGTSSQLSAEAPSPASSATSSRNARAGRSRFERASRSWCH